MKVIVTGATGLIGRALVRALLDRDDEVHALTRSVSKAKTQFGSRVKAQEWNPPHTGPWMEVFDGADAVVNLAGEPIAGTDLVKIVTKRWTETQKALIVSSRVDATTAVVEAIRQAATKPRVLLNQSAIGYYGSPGNVDVTETSPPGRDFVAHVVVEWEAAARPVEEMGVRLVLLRTGVVLDDAGGALPPMVLPFRWYVGGTMGMPGQWVSWIHRDDEIGLILFALDHPELQGVVNATAPNPVTMEMFSRQIGLAVHRPSWVPMIGTGLKLALGQQSEPVLASQRVLPMVAEKAGYSFRFTDSGTALQDLLAR